MATLDEKLNKYFHQVFSCPNSALYHYTSNSNDILKSSFLKLTAHHDLNKKDNGELIVGPTLAKKYLKKTDLAKFEPTLDVFLKIGLTMHIGSFSKEIYNKHAIEKYGPERLEFKNNFFKRLPNDYHALIGSVEYNPKLQNEVISTMFGLYEESEDEDLSNKRISLFMWLHIVAPLLKDQKHQADIESRIITVSGREKQNPHKIIGLMKDKITFNPDEVTLL